MVAAVAELKLLAISVEVSGLPLSVWLTYFFILTKLFTLGHLLIWLPACILFVVRPRTNGANDAKILYSPSDHLYMRFKGGSPTVFT